MMMMMMMMMMVMMMVMMMIRGFAARGEKESEDCASTNIDQRQNGAEVHYRENQISTALSVAICDNTLLTRSRAVAARGCARTWTAEK